MNRIIIEIESDQEMDLSKFVGDNFIANEFTLSKKMMSKFQMIIPFALTANGIEDLLIDPEFSKEITTDLKLYFASLKTIKVKLI